jgi:peptide chain release factor 3
VLQFSYRDHVINLLDTPGHGDFSEDTYRVLAAVDAAVMLLDASKGLEAQTLKLFDVCRSRGIPVLTFVNKWDVPGREALELLDEVEQTIGLSPMPVTWPVGIAGDLRGVVECDTGELRVYERTAGGATRGEVRVYSPDEAPAVEPLYAEGVVDELELLREIGAQFDEKRFLAGTATPVLFGAARLGVGVGRLLDALVDLAPSPAARDDATGTPRALDTPAVGTGVQGAGGEWTAATVTAPPSSRLLGALRARHGAHPRRQRPAVRHEVRPGRVRPAALHAGRGVPGRHRRAGPTPARCAPATPSTPSGRWSSPPSRASRPSTSRSSAAPTPGKFKQFRKGIASSTPRASSRCCAATGAATRPRCSRPSARCSSRWSARGWPTSSAPRCCSSRCPTRSRASPTPTAPPVLDRESDTEVLTRTSDGVLLAVFVNKWRLETIRRKHPDLTMEPLLAGTVEH